LRGKFGHMQEWFYAVNEGVLAVASVLLLVGAAEVGVLLARWPRSRHTGNPDRFLYTLATPLLGLLALMLGFSFGLSLSSHEARIMEVVDEADAIERAALRARMLQEPYASEVKALLKEYTMLRIAHRADNLDSPAMIVDVHDSFEIREKLWRTTMTAEAANPQLATTTLFVEALNNMIDTFAERLAAERNHAPPPIFFMLQTWYVPFEHFFARGKGPMGLFVRTTGSPGHSQNRARRFGLRHAPVGLAHRTAQAFDVAGQRAQEHLVDRLKNRSIRPRPRG